jgi:tubulin polyglutamylase TTLL5
MATAQFDRRGGFVRIFPAVDSWTKYSQYLDPATGIPISGNNNSYSSYNISGAHNYNLLLYTHLFPEVPINTKAFDKCNLKYSSLDRKRDLSLDSHKGTTLARQDRYERMLSQGHRSALAPKKTPKDSRSAELRKQIIDMLRNGKKMTQCETRRTFSHYLGCVLRRISAGPDQEDHMEIVLKFLQKASNYLRTPYTVKVTPSQSLDSKDRAAVVAKQLNDFLYLYNRETELFVDKTEKPSQIPSKLYAEFLENARECDLEEILIHQTTQTVPTHGGKTGFQGVLKCIPNVPKSYGLKPPYSKSAAKSKGLKVSSLS